MVETRMVVSLSDVLARVERLQSHKWDARAPWPNLASAPAGGGARLAVRGRARSLALTPIAFEQLCRRLGIPTHYAARLDPAMAVRLLDYGRRRCRVDELDQPVLLRGCAGCTSSTATTASNCAWSSTTSACR